MDLLLRILNPLTPNDTYSVRTAPLTSKRCILYIFSTNIGTEYFFRETHKRIKKNKWYRVDLLTRILNPLTPNDTNSGRTAPLTSKRCILYIFSTNIGTEYFFRET